MKKQKTFKVIHIILINLAWIASFVTLATVINTHQRVKQLENKEVHHLLPKGAKCRVKLFYFRDKDGKLMPGTSRMTYRVTPDALCHWRID